MYSPRSDNEEEDDEEDERRHDPRTRAKLRIAEPVLDGIRKFWKLMVSESAKISPQAGGDSVVTREGYTELHLRVSLALSAEEWGDLETARHVAHSDWTSDIATFVGADASVIWLQEIKKKFQELIRTTLKDNGGLEGLFQMYDDDGNGELDRREFVMAVRTDCNIAEEVVPDDKLATLFAMVDTDASGTVSAAEFKELLDAETTQARWNALHPPAPLHRSYSVLFAPRRT